MRVRLRLPNKSFVDGLVRRSIDTAEEVERLWRPGLVGEDDEPWDWREIVAEHASEDWTHFELTALEQAQGLMVLRQSWPMRAPANTNSTGCYIEYLAAAPWNRPPTGDTRYPRVTPVGLVLVGSAVRRSIELGHDGRLGWHSKPGAEKWYRDKLPGLWSGGPDVSEDGLEYFELTPAAACGYLSSNHALFAEE